jgi:hypothetical protein
MKILSLKSGRKSLLVSTVSAILLISHNTQASLDEKTSWNDGWQYPPEQRMENGDFALHVKRICLSQVLEEDLNAKYIKEYLAECAADYGVFELAAN